MLREYSSNNRKIILENNNLFCIKIYKLLESELKDVMQSQKREKALLI